ncbi:unnamed protein product [Lampetra planeri]
MATTSKQPAKKTQPELSHFGALPETSGGPPSKKPKFEATSKEFDAATTAAPTGSGNFEEQISKTRAALASSVLEFRFNKKRLQRAYVKATCGQRSATEQPRASRAAVLQETDWEAARQSLEVDNSVGEVAWAQPGTAAGLEMLNSFINERLKLFSTDRNNPNSNALSNLSPWIHFGAQSKSLGSRLSVICIKVNNYIF